MQTLDNYLQEHYSKTSTSGYRNMINKYLAYMGDRAKKAVYQDILNYIGYLRTKQLHPKSLRNHLFVIKIYYRWLASTGQRNDHPCQDLHLQDKINRSIVVENLYTMKELEAFLEQYEPRQSFLKQRDKVIICLLIYQALTVSEISQLELIDIDLEKGSIYIKSNVKTKSRTLPLKPNQIMMLHKYITETRAMLLSRNKDQNCEDKNMLILSHIGSKIKHNGISRLINNQGPDQRKMLPLKIRQSVIAHLLKQNNDLRIVQVFAGHKRAASTEEYKRSGLEELKTAIQKHHPLQ